MFYDHVKFIFEKKRTIYSYRDINEVYDVLRDLLKFFIIQKFLKMEIHFDKKNDEIHGHLFSSGFTN